MASLGTLSVTLQINQGNLQYQSRPTSFQFAVAGTNGPSPGALTISVNGTDITIPQLDSMGGLAWLQNLDPTNYVTVGLRDTATNVFYPFAEILPGEMYPVRISRKLPKHETGTGTFSGSNVVLHAKADTANIIMRWDQFDP